MPFAAWFGQLFASIVAYFAQFFGKKLTVIAAAVASFTALLLAFKVSVDAILTGLQSVTPNGIVLTGLQLLPDNTSACVGAMASTYIAAQVYTYWKNVLDLRVMY